MKGGYATRKRSLLWKRVIASAEYLPLLWHGHGHAHYRPLSLVGVNNDSLPHAPERGSVVDYMATGDDSQYVCLGKPSRKRFNHPVREVS